MLKKRHSVDTDSVMTKLLELADKNFKANVMYDFVQGCN